MTRFVPDGPDVLFAATRAGIAAIRAMNEAELLLSIVVPTYQRPRALARCLRTLAAQTLPPSSYEIVVVDDGSVPPAIIPANSISAPGSPAIRLIRQLNQGPAAARNTGAAAANGRWIAFTDDDCIAHGDWAAQLLLTLQREPRAIIGGWTENGLPENLFSQASEDLLAALYSYFPRARWVRPFLAFNNVALEREAFLQSGGLDRRFPFAAAEDRDFCERWTDHGGRLTRCPAARVRHFHAMNVRAFVRQHHIYGRGAALLDRVRQARRAGPLRPELRLYLEMMTLPFRRHGFPRGMCISGLISLSQVAMISGYFWERISARYSASDNPLPPLRADKSCSVANAGQVPGSDSP